ncbi:nucleotide exchange factor GrpE [Geobacter pickeringii]|uniref:Uncharacterized protein n=1 Tax=Geobacter pickeringii TaxID=345632 RepID=A0A0B5BEL9_9BACT|nr:hypothetical protein [Geobacter pickeringii]AJE03604.1 hypothetical protein GPICK_09795 [Geobacter pickeringii]
MNRKSIIAVTAALGIFAGGMAYAGGCDMCGKEAGCNNDQSVQQYQQATEQLRARTKSLDLAIRTEYSYNQVNIQRIEALEKQLKEAKAELRAQAEKYNVPTCCLI